MNYNNILGELSRIKTPETTKEKMYKEILKKAVEKKRRNYPVWMIPAAAAIVLAIIFIPQFINNSRQTLPERHTSIIGGDHSPDNSTLMSEAQNQSKPIIEGINGVCNEAVPNQGEVYITPTLEEEMKQYGPDDVLFHVNILVYADITNDFKYEGKTLEEYRNDPALKFYNEAYDKWRIEVYFPLNEEMTAAEERGEEYAQGWWKHSTDQLFKEYWQENQPQDVLAAYEPAREQYNEAHKAYEEWIRSPDGAYAFTLELTKTECDRLNSLGYDLEVNFDNPFRIMELTGYLTRFQIEEFSVNTSYGYIVMWADGENVMND